MTNENKKLHIRWMIQRDCTQVAALEMRLQAQGDNFLPWIDFEALFGERKDRYRVGMVAEYGDEIVGYMVFHRKDNEPMELLHFGTAPEYHSLEIGNQLMGKLLYKMRTHRHESLNCTIPENEQELLQLFRASGLRAIRLDKEHFTKEEEEDGQKQEKTQDGYVMQWQLKSTPDTPHQNRETYQKRFQDFVHTLPADIVRSLNHEIKKTSSYSLSPPQTYNVT